MTRRRAAAVPAQSSLGMRRAILRWFRASARDLPWRRTRDPYAIWVSEVMLQQTRVSVVVPYYERFLDAFPDPATLGAASDREVLRLWEGLGYYRRARSLRAGATALVDRHDGVFPRDPAAALELPGVGPYTAAAVLSIAYGVPLACVDGNVRRVVARLLAIEDPPGSAPFERAVAAWLNRALDPGDPGGFNQAMMELGACVCLPKTPDCASCPAAPFCAARAQDPVRFPRRQPVRAVTARREAALIWQSGGKVLVEERPPRSRWQGLWEFPRIRLARDADPLDVVRRMSTRRYDAVPACLRHAGRLRYAVTRYRTDLDLVVGRGGAPRIFPERARLAAAEDLERLPMPAPLRRAWTLVLSKGGDAKKGN